MSIASICLVVACLLPLVCAAIAKSPGFGRPRRDGGFDNHNPRAWLAAQGGWQARANAAQQNSFEALPFFIAAVLTAQQAQTNLMAVSCLSLLFILFRIGFIAAYLADKASLRSFFWLGGLLCCLGLFLSVWL